MKSLASSILRLLRAEDGPTSVEYALLLVLVLAAVLAGVTMFGEATNACFEHSRDEIYKAIN